jgi:hypothetical protein
MSIQIREIVKLFGRSIEDQEVAAVLKRAGFDPKLPMATLRKSGMYNIVDAARGVELMFREREGFLASYGDAKSDGEGLLVSVATYPKRQQELQALPRVRGRWS